MKYTIAGSLCTFRQAVAPYVGYLLTDEEIIETFGLNEAELRKMNSAFVFKTIEELKKYLLS